MRLAMPAKFPLVLGYDVAGEVVEIGPEVSLRFEPGDAIFGGVDVKRQGGSYAELVLAREAALAPKPEALSFEEAAAMPTSGLTALRPGDRRRTGPQGKRGDQRRFPEEWGTSRSRSPALWERKPRP